MKRFKISILLSIISAISFISCEENVNPKLLEVSEEKIVVNGFISPSSDVIIVEVSRTKPVVGRFDEFEDKSDYIIKNAVVILSNESGQSVQLNYDNNTLRYEIETEQFPVNMGETYYLTVKVGSKELSSSCEVPGNEPTDIGVRVADIGMDKKWFVDFKDVAGEDNFYRISAFVKDEFSYSSIYFDLQSFQTDAVGDGETITAESMDSYYNSGDSVAVIVTVVSETLYRYQYASYNHNGDDPFSEPVIFPSNINGGLGIFGSYVTVQRKFKIE